MFGSWVGKIPWRRERLHTSVFWPGEIHGLYSLGSRKESDTTEQLSLSCIYILTSLISILQSNSEYKWIQLLWKTVWRFITKLNVLLPYHPVMVLLGIYRKEPGPHTNLHTHIDSSILTAKTRKSPRCPSVT